MDKKFHEKDREWQDMSRHTNFPGRGKHLVRFRKQGQFHIGAVRNQIRQAPYVPAPRKGMRWENGRSIPRFS